MRPGCLGAPRLRLRFVDWEKRALRTAAWGRKQQTELLKLQSNCGILAEMHETR